MKQAPQLERLQRRFWELIVAPYGVKDALSEVAEKDPDCAPLLNWVKAPDEETAIFRLDIYANMFFFRLVDVLRDQFEALSYAMEHDTFKLMCVDFFQMYPTENFSLDYVGDDLPTFLKEHSPPDQPPWLAELAELERARYQMIVAPDSEALTPEILQQISPEQWGEIRFKPIAGLRLMEFEYPIHLVWRAMRDETEVPTLEPEPTAIVVWRNGFTVTHEVPSPAVTKAIKLLLEEETFQEICMSFLPDDDDEEETDPAELQALIQSAYQTLVSWVQNGMLRKLQ